MKVVAKEIKRVDISKISLTCHINVRSHCLSQPSYRRWLVKSDISAPVAVLFVGEGRRVQLVLFTQYKIERENELRRIFSNLVYPAIFKEDLLKSGYLVIGNFLFVVFFEHLVSRSLPPDAFSSTGDSSNVRAGKWTAISLELWRGPEVPREPLQDPLKSSGACL